MRSQRVRCPVSRQTDWLRTGPRRRPAGRRRATLDPLTLRSAISEGDNVSSRRRKAAGGFGMAQEQRRVEDEVG